MSRALVTGGAGFIGSNLVDALLMGGSAVSVFDSLSTGRESNLRDAIDGGAELVVGDVTDFEQVTAAVSGRQPEVIFHLAAQIDVRKSVADPAFDARVNVEGTINVLRAAHEAGVGRVVFVSTGGAAYGEPDYLPADENHPLRPVAAYGNSKLAAETYCALFTRLHGLSTVSLRLGNVFGPRQDPLGEAGVIAIFCGSALSGQRPVIFGDGTQTRDYIFVDDVVAAAITAGQRPEVNGSFNIGTGRETSVLELQQLIAPYATGDFNPGFQPARLGEIQRSSLDSTKAANTLDWSATATVEAGIAATFAATSSISAGP